MAGMARLIELKIGGMTCAACAGRIEKRLNRLDGVTATVNYATEKARARVPESLTAADLAALSVLLRQIRTLVKTSAAG